MFTTLFQSIVSSSTSYEQFGFELMIQEAQAGTTKIFRVHDHQLYLSQESEGQHWVAFAELAPDELDYFWNICVQQGLLKDKSETNFTTDQACCAVVLDIHLGDCAFEQRAKGVSQQLILFQALQPVMAFLEEKALAQA